MVKKMLVFVIFLVIAAGIAWQIFLPQTPTSGDEQNKEKQQNGNKQENKLDAELPQDEDLRFVAKKLGDEENGFNHIKLASEKVYYPQEALRSINPNFVAPIKNYAKIASTEKKFELLKKNEEMFTHLKKAIDCSEAEYSQEIGRIQDPLKIGLINCRNIAHVMSINALFLFQNGKQKQAMQEAVNIIEIGNLLANSRGPLIVYAIAVAIQNIGIQQLHWMIRETDLPAKELKPFIQNLRRYKSGREPFCQALQMEYMSYSRLLDELASGKISVSELSGNDSFVKKMLSKVTTSKPFFLPNRTKILQAGYYRRLIKMSKANYFEQKKEMEKINQELVALKESFRGIKMLRPNIVGQIITAISLPGIASFSTTRVQLAAQFEITELLIAVKSYKQDNGQLPDSLEKLVPKYIDQIPIDPVDGKKMRYSLQNKYLFSLSNRGSYTYKNKRQRYTWKKLKEELDSGKIPLALQSKFINSDMALSNDASLKPGPQKEQWLLEDNGKEYLFKKKDYYLQIYRTSPKVYYIYSIGRTLQELSERVAKAIDF